MNVVRFLIVCILIISSFTLYFPLQTEAGTYAGASSAILMEQESGRVLYEKEAHKKRRIASITKIMTAVLAIESGKLDKTVTVSSTAVRAEGSSIYLKPGEKIKLEDLVYGLMLRSGNDSAVAIAEYVGGSLDGFIYLMNQKAEEIGMKNTNFANPHGLDDHENHYSTAYDMALLTKYAMTDDTYRKISGTKVHRAPNPTEKWDRVWKNKNRLLTGLYDHTTGGKTGYTKRAKRTLVTTASKNGLSLIAVTLNGPDDWNDHINMYEYGFKHYQLVKVLKKGIMKDLNSDDFYKKKVYIKRDFYYPVAANEKDNFEIEIKLREPKDEWRNNRIVPDDIGTAIVYFDHQPVKEIPLLYKYEKRKEEKSFLEIFRDLFFIQIGVESDG